MIEWIEYVKAWNNDDRFPEDTGVCLGCSKNCTLEITLENIKRQIKDHLCRCKKLPLERTYSSKGMNEFQKLIFLIEQTAKEVLGDDMSKVMISIIFDEYNIALGHEGIYELINNYVLWSDIN